MVPEAILVAVLVITFIADFIAHGKEDKSWLNPLVSVMLLVSAIATLFVGDDQAVLFGGAYVATPANTMMKAILCSHASGSLARMQRLLRVSSTCSLSQPCSVCMS